MAEKWVWFGKLSDMPPSQRKWGRRYLITIGALFVGLVLVINLGERWAAEKAAAAAKSAAEVRAHELDATKPAAWATFADDARQRLDTSERGTQAMLKRLSQPMPRLEAYRLAQSQAGLQQTLAQGSARLQRPEALAKDAEAKAIHEAVDQAIGLRWLAFGNLMDAADKDSVAEEAAAVERFERAHGHSQRARTLIDRALGHMPPGTAATR